MKTFRRSRERRPGVGPLGAVPGQAEAGLRFAAVVPARMEAVGDLRRAVAAVVRWWGVEDCGDLLLVVSELAANAVEHGQCRRPEQPAIGVRIALCGARLRIEVTDGNAQAVPLTQPQSEAAERGRGLLLVAVLTDSWGTHIAEGGKTVWADMRISRTAGIAAAPSDRSA